MVLGNNAMNACLRFALLGFIAAVCGSQGWAQATAETAAATSAVGVSATTAKDKAKPSNKPEKKGISKGDRASAFLPFLLRNELSVERDNRRKLEARTNQDGAILVLRSSPDSGQVWVNGKAVGSTPLLLTLRPGSYSIEVEDRRMRMVSDKVNLLPKERRIYVVHLKQRYPTEIRLK